MGEYATIPEACPKCGGKGYVYMMPERGPPARQISCQKCLGSGIAPWADPTPMRRRAPAKSE